MAEFYVHTHGYTIYERKKNEFKILKNSKKAMLKIKCLVIWQKKGQISGHYDKLIKISGPLEISGQFQDSFKISGISGQVAPLTLIQLYR